MAKSVGGVVQGAGEGRVEVGGAVGAKRRMWEVLGSRDPKTFAANLRAAGFAVGVVRGAIYALLRDLQTAERTKAVDLLTNTSYWKNEVTPEAQAAYSKDISRLWLDRDRVMRSIFPEEQEAFVLKMQARFGPIAESTMEKISALEQDYSEMLTQARVASNRGGGYPMPWAGEQVAFLNKEKEKDMAALLSPQELEQYQLKGSSLGTSLQRQLDGFEPTEQEYRDIYRLRAAAEEAGRTGGALYNFMSAEGRAATQAMQEGLKSTLGEARFADYQRSLDAGYQIALNVTRTLDLPASAATEAYTAQAALKEREMAVQRDAALSPAERTAQLAAITAERKQKLTTILTPAGAEQFLKGRMGFFLSP